MTGPAKRLVLTPITPGAPALDTTNVYVTGNTYRAQWAIGTYTRADQTAPAHTRGKNEGTLTVRVHDASTLARGQFHSVALTMAALTLADGTTVGSEATYTMTRAVIESLETSPASDDGITPESYTITFRIDGNGTFNKS